MKTADKEEKPTIFSLLAPLSARARQEFGSRRHELKRKPGIIEELLKDEGTGEWYLAYSDGKGEKKELRIAASSKV